MFLSRTNGRMNTGIVSAVKSVVMAFGMIAFASFAYAAEPQPWQLGLQPASGSVASAANDLHNLLLVIITAISIFCSCPAGLYLPALPRKKEPKSIKHNT